MVGVSICYLYEGYIWSKVSIKPRTNKIKKIERKGKATERLTYKIA